MIPHAVLASSEEVSDACISCMAYQLPILQGGCNTLHAASEVSVCTSTVQSKHANVMPCPSQVVGVMNLPYMGTHAQCSYHAKFNTHQVCSSADTSMPPMTFTDFRGLDNPTRGCKSGGSMGKILG